MDASKLFKTLVIGGASLALNACGPASSNKDAGEDAGTCTCQTDATYAPSQDCTLGANESVCCWLESAATGPSAACCPQI